MKKILIVDDSAFMQKAAAGILLSKYQVVTASSGQEALEVYRRERPDLILSDLYMPQMSGLELQRVLQEESGRAVPFIFMTADEREENESLGLEAGAFDYIRKPFKPGILRRRVENAIRQIESAEKIRGLRTVLETDPMTGLFNKSYAQKVLTDVCASETGVLMMVDLDSFKLVNDLYGHAMGDKILIRFGEILRSVIRTSDIAGRVGGDEFMLFCRDSREESLIARKSRQMNEGLLSAARELMGPDMTIPLGASIGAVAVPDEGTDFRILRDKADQALYQVKRNGKHGYAFFGGESSQGGASQSASSDMADVRMILGERNRQQGAYALGFDDFRTVYRFLVRTVENYRRKMELLLYTLSGDAEAVEQFGAALGKTLRRSDVYSKYGKNQYLVVLLEIQPDNTDIVLNRIQSNWEKTGLADRLQIQCESVPLEIP